MWFTAERFRGVRKTCNDKLEFECKKPNRCPFFLVSQVSSCSRAQCIYGSKWWFQNLKWELIDLGSLNGTLLNSQPINHPDTGSRLRGDPTELASGDIITLGTTSNVYVSLYSSFAELYWLHLPNHHPKNSVFLEEELFTWDVLAYSFALSVNYYLICSSLCFTLFSLLAIYGFCYISLPGYLH